MKLTSKVIRGKSKRNVWSV